jgi:ribosomal protein S18 acetylase RimI-like enzyme
VSGLGDDARVFGETLMEGHNVPREIWPTPLRDQQHWAAVRGWRRYVAWLGDEPAGAAVLALDGDIGYLANASTRPAYRRHGAQTALIAARVGDSRAAGAAYLASIALEGSSSQRNLERWGLRQVGTLVEWRLTG